MKTAWHNCSLSLDTWGKLTGISGRVGGNARPPARARDRRRAHLGPVPPRAEGETRFVRGAPRFRRSPSCIYCGSMAPAAGFPELELAVRPSYPPMEALA